MSGESGKRKNERENERPNLEFLRHLAQAFAGAILFSFPILMTMETWFLGFYMDGKRLALFTLFTIPLLIGLSYYDGFAPTSRLIDDIVDTFVAYFVGFICSAALLFLFGTIDFTMSADEISGKIAIQTIIGGFGAMFAQSQIFGGDDEKEEETADRKRAASYYGELFLMIVGAIFLAMSVAPTEEVILISFQMNEWHTFGLILLTLALMQAFFYAVEFSENQEMVGGGEKTFAGVFFRFTTTGYAIALLISFYILWTFGSLDEMGAAEQLKAVVVLAFPAAVGASASRFIL